MNGVLVVDKPSGPTSHDVVARVRRALGTRRVGHTGTLDPLATGVLPLVIGRATRLAQFLSSDDKEYVADVIFGVSTTTYDALGETLPSESTQPVDLAKLEPALSEFRGTYLQRPPAFSAKKISGKPAYELARSGVAPELTSAEVTVTALEVVERGENSVRLRVACTAGFYVRTLAHELGQRLGCGAHLAALRRTRAGAFELSDAVPLDTLEREALAGAERIVPLERLLPGLSAVVLTEEGVRRTSHGNLLSSSTQKSREGDFERPVRLFDEGGRLIGIAEPEPGGSLHPVIVLM
jgi:tRNA pseudouridine55 synthase